MYVYQDPMMAPAMIPRREQMGHRRPGTGRRTTPSKSAFGPIPAGPLSQGMAAVPGYGGGGGGGARPSSSRREMFERRPGTGRTTTPRRFDSIHESAMKNPNGRLASSMKMGGGGMADRSFGAEMTNGSYRAQSRTSNIGGYPQQQQQQQQTVYQQQPQPVMYQQPPQQVVYQQPQPVMYQAPPPQPVVYQQPQPVQYVQEPSQQYHEEPSQYAQEQSFTALRQQPARSMKRKAGTGRVTARGGFNFKISAESREAARRNVAHKHAEQSAMQAAEMQAQQSMRIAQQSMQAAQLASQLPYHSDTSAEYSEEEGMAMAVRPPPPGAMDMMGGEYDEPQRSRTHRSRRTHRRHDDEEVRRRPDARAPPREQHYPPAARVSSYESPESVEFSNDNGAEVSAVEDSAAESSVASSEAETEQETTIDPDEAVERQRLEEEERKAWEKHPADEIAEIEKKQQEEEEEEEAEQPSFDQEPDMGGMDNDMPDMGGGSDFYDDEEEEVEIVQPAAEKAKKKDKKEKAKKKKAAAPKRKAENYEYVPVEQPQAYVITPPAEPTAEEQTPGCRRSRRRKMSPLAWWKGESVLYNRRMSAACIDVKAIRKCPDALTPYKRRRMAGDDAPLAICDRTVDSDDASAVNVSVGSDGGASP
jgi:hypothetical protein